MQFSSENERADESLKLKIQSLITSTEVQQKVLEKLSFQSISEPYLKLEILNCNSPEFQISESDLLKVFECFGKVVSLKFSGKHVIIHYETLVSAYFAITILDGKALPDLCVTLQLSWHSPPVQRGILQEIVVKSANTEEKLKHTCRFDVQIANEKTFQVAKRVIGPKGLNMKKIIEKCCKGMTGQSHDIIKLRLRGVGSGFKEGPNNTESTDALHLCVSSKYQTKFLLAVEEIEKLLKSIYKDYKNFCTNKGLPAPSLEVVKTEKLSGRNLLLPPTRFKEIENTQSLTENDIEELVDIRNEARRQCNFVEADRIREMLRKKGIVLTDEKGRRGRGVEVTTWKYGKH